MRAIAGPRLEHIDPMGAYENADIACRIIEIPEDPGVHGANLDAGRLQPLRNPVIAPGTFVGGLRLLVEVPRTIRTSLDTVPAANAVFFVDEYHAVRRLVGGPNRTNLHAGWILAVVAQLRDKEGLFYFLVPVTIAKAVILRGIGCCNVHRIRLAVDARFILTLEVHVTLHPGAKVIRIEGDFVLDLAGLDAAQAADAALRIDPECPTALGPVVIGDRPRRGKLRLGRRRLCSGSAALQRDRRDTRTHRRGGTHLPEQRHETAPAQLIRD